MLDLTNDKRMTVIKNFLRANIENNVPLPIYLDNFEMVLLHDLVSMLSSYYKGAASGDIILDQKGKYKEIRMDCNSYLDSLFVALISRIEIEAKIRGNLVT